LIRTRNVWFLAGAFTGTAERTCEVPAGRAIAISNGIECNSAQDGPVSGLTKCAKGGLDFLKHAEVTLDGQALDNLSRYRVTTPPTTVVFPDDAIYGAPKGGTTLVADVLLPMIRPLSRGNHSLSFKTHSSSY
jgi:hypothetical protein